MTKNGSTCCIFNLAPHYRDSIFRLMDQMIGCDFYIGDRIGTPMSLMKYSDLKGFRKVIQYRPLFGNFYWQKGAVGIAFKSYNHYIITGDPFCISTWLIILITKLLGKKTYLWTHGWYGHENSVKKIAKKLFFGLSYRVVLYGNHARSLMIKEGFPPDKLVVIYNSLDYDAQSKARETIKMTNVYEKHFQNNDPVVIFIGRLQKEKRLELLIESQKYLKNKSIFFNLVLIGTGENEKILRDLALKYSLIDRIWFYGPCYDEQQIAPLFYYSSLTISPGDIGLTAIHSMVYGTPVLTHSNIQRHGPEFESIISGITGDFFEENSLSDLCEKIVTWLFLPDDKREFVRQQCFAVIKEKYNPNVQIEIFKKLISGSL